MPNLFKEIDKCKHPNSRKTKRLGKKLKQQNNREKQKFGHVLKSNLLGDLLIWFTDKTADVNDPLSPAFFEDLIQTYLNRFEEELKQIKLKQSISKNRSKQHLNRENVIKMTNERERNEFNSCGIEMMDLCDPIAFKAFKDWDGNSINIQHLKFSRISKSKLENMRNKSIMDVE